MKSASKILIAVSGGVDSSVAAALLGQQGYHCQAAYMITHDAAVHASDDVRSLCDSLGIQLHILDWRDRFELVRQYFLSEYQSARTPNPCVFCNRNMKFAGLLDFARSLGIDRLATGHYARILCHNGDYGLYTAVNTDKDQSYALGMIDRSILPHLIFPLGSLSKDRTRAIAAELSLQTAHKPDSQEICFIPDNNYPAYLERLCPAIKRPGDIIDTQGKKLGTHNGIYKYTIGQRRGLKVAMGTPYYVVRLDAEKNQVVLGPKSAVLSDKLYATDTNWLCEKIHEPFHAIVKIRYNHKPSPAKINPQPDGSLSIIFDQNISAITPGQTAVIYKDDDYGTRLLAAAWIEKAARTTD